MVCISINTKKIKTIIQEHFFNNNNNNNNNNNKYNIKKYIAR